MGAMSFLRKFCCCGEEEDDFSGPYERLSEDGAIAVVRSRNTDSVGTGYDQPDGIPTERTPVKEQNEEEIMNTILDETQQNIIDVSHMDGIVLSTNEYMQRFNQYVESVKLHDSSVPSKKQIMTAAASAPKNGKPRVLLEETPHTKLVDRLCRTPLNEEKMNEFSRIASDIATAVSSVQIECKKELVSHGL